MASKQDTLKRSPIASDSELEADPLRQASVHAPPKGSARVWFYPSRNHRGSAFRDIDPKSELDDLETGAKVSELDIWKRKLADPNGMHVQSIVLPTGKVLNRGDKVAE